jgi:inorganic pyrophosphatase
LEDVPSHHLKEIEHFFQVYGDLEDKVVSTEGYGRRAEALDVIAEARERIGRS